jgi:hypothetical protein
MLVLATITAPAARSRRTAGASAVAGGASASTFDPARVGSPATSNRSLMVMMAPSSGPRLVPLRARASAASAAARAAWAYTVRQAREPSPFRSAMRASASSTRSRAERGGGAPIPGACCCARAMYGEASNAVAAPAKRKNRRRTICIFSSLRCGSSLMPADGTAAATGEWRLRHVPRRQLCNDFTPLSRAGLTPRYRARRCDCRGRVGSKDTPAKPPQRCVSGRPSQPQ